MKEYLRLLRPKQWVKNGFVFMGLLFGHAWNRPDQVLRIALAATAFSLVASGVYILNDLFDAKSDATHSRKRLRPIAAGTVSSTSAMILLIVLWAVGFVVG